MAGAEQPFQRPFRGPQLLHLLVQRLDPRGRELAAELRRFEARWLRGIPGHAACVAWSAAKDIG